MLGNIALALVVILFGAYAAAVIIGLVAFYPYGLAGLVVLGILAFLFAAVTVQRLTNREDRHYVENVKE